MYVAVTSPYLRTGALQINSSLPSSIFPSLVPPTIMNLAPPFLQSNLLLSLPNSIFHGRGFLMLAPPSQEVTHLLPIKNLRKLCSIPLIPQLLCQTLILNLPFLPSVSLNINAYSLFHLSTHLDLQPSILDFPPPSGEHPT